MKIAVICREHPDHYNGGLSIAAWNTARAAAENPDCKVTFITSQRPDGFADAEVRNGVKIIWMAGTSNRDYPGFLSTVAGAFPVYQQQHGFDLVHGHGYSAASLAVNPKARCGLPIIFHDHGSKISYAQSVLNAAVLGHDPTWALENQRYLGATYFGPQGPIDESDFAHMRRYDAVVATSTPSYVDFTSRYMLTNVYKLLHPMYQDAPVPRLMGVDPQDPLIALFSGDLFSPWKVHRPSVLKLSPILRPNGRCRLSLIGGRGSLLHEKLVAEGLPTEAVAYYGDYLTEVDALRRLKQCSVLFECSIHHMGTNLTGLSALMLGIPVVAFPTGGHIDMVGQKTGLLVDPVNGDIPGVVGGAVKNSAILGQAARSRFERKFSPHVARARMIEIYHQVLGDSR